MRPSIIPAILRHHRPRLGSMQMIPTLLSSHAPYSSSPPSSSSSPQPPPFNPETYLHAARQKLTAQPPTLIPDNLSPTPSRLLTLSLADHIPSLFPLEAKEKEAGKKEDDGILPQGHHLVYFPPQLPPSALMPDGTDPAHWPGKPFVRRMWAGGGVVFRKGWEREMRLDGRGVVCVESVGEPVLKLGSGDGNGGEKVFVEVCRRYGVDVNGGDGPAVEEVRRLVFMREREGGGKGTAEVGRVVRASATPEFTFSLKPDATLLFHFSALTYNAHAIHIDPDYARNREGYKGLLVHGPLTLVLMLSALRACLARLQPHGGMLTGNTPAEGRGLPHTKSLNYRNLAPLYVNEEMRVCLRRTKTDRDELGWDVWIEGPEGGLAVKGHAVTTGVSQAA
ncbi:hypothetical protein C8A00DRAFT_41540 [Chaetomidium leptoderma]|uniref:Uncharacterized protein n=1 Tax=Chaetomidium leptoderma TaxID=669021 RepID=A0AAN7A0M6_9PEZI|nr:hypothetical protein C8A00DRAFT_41540 [Chaetomidium leptoderma]